jgi:hypothetical protein
LVIQQANNRTYSAIGLAKILIPEPQREVKTKKLKKINDNHSRKLQYSNLGSPLLGESWVG